MKNRYKVTYYVGTHKISQIFKSPKDFNDFCVSEATAIHKADKGSWYNANQEEDRRFYLRPDKIDAIEFKHIKPRRSMTEAEVAKWTNVKDDNIELKHLKPR